MKNFHFIEMLSYMLNTELQYNAMSFFHLETIMKAISEEQYQKNHMTMGMLEGWLASRYLSLDGCVNWLEV